MAGRTTGTGRPNSCAVHAARGMCSASRHISTNYTPLFDSVRKLSTGLRVEQAATGTYDSTQRLMLDSEFQQMAKEIDRIARSTDFNGITLLDGTLSGRHDGSGLVSTGSAKIHFGTANDSAEDYFMWIWAEWIPSGSSSAVFSRRRSLTGRRTHPLPS